MRIVWNADRTDNPRVVILDFDRAAFGQDGSSYSREQSTLTEFMVELGAWEVKDTVTDWLTGPGNVRFDEFGIGLIPPEGREAYRQAKAQERLQMQLYLETDEAKRYREEWTAKYNDLLVNGWDDKT